MKIWLSPLLIILTMAIIPSCSTGPSNSNHSTIIENFPDSRFLIFSDPHFLSPDLYSQGLAFQNHLLYKKGNLTEYGPAILEALTYKIGEENPDFVLVSGDLTNNGERKSHLGFIEYLKMIENSGVPVFVIPGNHDMDNPYSRQFTGNRSFPVPSISRGEFLSLYGDFGYDEAFSRDKWSLSYAMESAPGLILIGLDSTVPGEGYGYIHRETLDWLEGELNKARNAGKGVILFMHHPLLEHFPGQDGDREMKLRNRNVLLNLLIDYDVKTVFTGHYHALDIVSYTNRSRTIYDIETGSLISWPFSYRKVTLNPEEIIVSSGSLVIPQISGKGRELSYNRIFRFADSFLSRYGVRDDDRVQIADYVSEVLLNHYEGNEEDHIEPTKPGHLGLLGRMALFAGRNYYAGRLEDPEPDDLTLIIDLKEKSGSPLP